MTRKQALDRVIEGYEELCNAEEAAIADKASVVDYIFKGTRICSLNRELRKRLDMMIMIIDSELTREQDFQTSNQLSE